ncbi:hypothetical protein E2P81_ATG05670 [Venturia nashicola]|uniref:RING-type domain-containing protein n=1 Tax=Venturia nashicola TaxID=86259 RepID=A0A4Z1P8X5_9PEZI|nr:hypothetical protein E6O75_ATG05810 [Venturia nashicola]TLD29376.1 hypothetical protein E2P81_ATG05670 [Venturia nashicola]
MASSANINKKICGICSTLPASQPNPEGVVEDIVKLPCNHIFGDKCIDTWLKTREHGHCPACHVDCPKDFVDTWKLLRETVKAGESLGVGEEDWEADFLQSALKARILEFESLEAEKNGTDVKDEDIIEDKLAFDENAVDEDASGESAIDEETLVEEVGEAQELKEDTIAENAVKEEVIEEAAIEFESGQVAAIDGGHAEEGAVQEEVVEEEVIAEETVGEEGVDEGTAQKEVDGENATGETTQDKVAAEITVQEGVAGGNAAEKDGQGPAWGTAQEGPELQAARCLHFFRTHDYGDQYRTELEASRSAAGRSTRNMVSAFNIKAHPLPEGRERAQVSKNIQVWAKYLHALKLKSLDELKTTKSRKFRVDIAGWYENQREDFFEQVGENLESNNLAGPDVDAVKMAEDLLKSGDAGKIAELESILASLEEPAGLMGKLFHTET